MRRYEFDAFGLENLKLVQRDVPTPAAGEVVLDVKAMSLNYRDLLVTRGLYNPKLELPAVPLSDGAGSVSAVGEGVTRVKVGDRVMSHFIAGWIDGPFKLDHVASTLGTPGPGLAAEQVALPADAVVPLPTGYSFAQASTLPIAALTAWSALRTVTHVEPGQTVLTLGTGGVSIFALQLAKAMGARVIITSSSDEKLARCRQFGADHTINYRANPKWERQVLEYTGGAGVDVVVETVGPGTLDQSMKSTRAEGTIALPGALTGGEGHVTTRLILMRRLHIAGIMVDCRRAFENMVAFIEQHKIKPVIHQEFPFADLPIAMNLMASGSHFGKIVVNAK
ncbi:MAG: NAD(P)-dependent alcohol dehydrogenase [Phycisphaerae bacterium]|nr:NAD(P)-dependent alcohol dehydrogenase [Phycisphaerae bacterium]